jgi:hypothetical protein
MDPETTDSVICITNSCKCWPQTFLMPHDGQVIYPPMVVRDSRFIALIQNSKVLIWLMILYVQ